MVSKRRDFVKRKFKFILGQLLHCFSKACIFENIQIMACPGYRYLSRFGDNFMQDL